MQEMTHLGGLMTSTAALTRLRASRSVVAVVVIVFLSLTAIARTERVLEHEAIINAPVEEVWRMSTTEDGASTWMAPNIEIDLRVGGTIRSSYNPESTLDDEHTIINRILAYEPRRMIAVRNEQAPDGFAWTEKFQQTWSVTYLEPIDDRKTRVRIVGLGYGEGPEWDALYAFFEQGNASLLKLLKQQFSDPPADQGDRIMTLLHTLVGGEWIHESETAAGGVFRARTIVEEGPDGVSLTSRGWLGNAEGMFDHGRTMIHRVPPSHGGGVRFLNINERGAIARGAITLVGENGIRWHWSAVNMDGDESHFRVDMHFTGKDRYQFTLHRQSGDGTWQQATDAAFERVDSAPSRFRPGAEK